MGSNGEYTGNSLRLGSDVFTSKVGKLNAKTLLNTNEKNDLSPQLRITLSSKDLDLFKVKDIKFKGNLENRTTFKFDEELKKQDISNSARLNFKAQKGKYTIYSAFKFDCSENKPDVKFNGTTLGIQKSFGKKFSTYVESYMPKECFQGNLKNTSYALGMALKF